MKRSRSTQGRIISVMKAHDAGAKTANLARKLSFCEPAAD
jgi:hypothetical protein